MANTYEGIPKIHIFDGERFRLHESFLTFNDALWATQKLESAGWQAYIIKIMGLHVVYKRR